MFTYDQIKNENTNRIIGIMAKDDKLRKLIDKIKSGTDYFWTSSGDILRGAEVNLKPYENVIDELNEYLYDNEFLQINESLPFRDAAMVEVGEYQGDCIVLHKQSLHYYDASENDGPVILGNEILAETHNSHDTKEYHKLFQMLEDEQKRRGEYFSILEYNEGYDSLTHCKDYSDWLNAKQGR